MVVLGIRLFIKKSLFPVQRMAKIVASWAAAISFFFHFFFWVGGRKILSIFCWGGGGFVQKGGGKSPVAPFLVAPPLHLKQNYFYGQPKVVIIITCTYGNKRTHARGLFHTDQPVMCKLVYIIVYYSL